MISNEMSSSTAHCQKFQNMFVVFKAEIVKHIKSNGVPADAVDWYVSVSCLIHSRERLEPLAGVIEF
jgi:hypothetical protein